MMREFSSAASLAIFRLSLGVCQGLALYLLYLANDDRSWPATNGLIFAPLLMLTLFIPLLASQAAGNMRIRTLVLWTGGAALIVAALAVYDIWRAWPVDWSYAPNPSSTTARAVVLGLISRPHIMPSWELFLGVAIGLFIAQSLVAGGDHDRRFIALYTTHFDVAWKQGLQLALSAAFVGAFWVLLWLGAGLFALLKIDFLTRLYRHSWFWIPATTLAVSAAIHLTDVRAGLVRGTRTLVLTLLSWLSPLAALLVGAFLVTLIVTGLEPLWSTRHASGLLLTTAAILIFLTNTVYQDGATERAAPQALRYAASAAALILVPLAALAAYALELRIAQYGWTVDRVIMTAVVFVVGCYAVGYVRAALTRGPWLKPVERWNFYTSFVVLAALLALFSLLADPARISVASQVARLESGEIAPDKFDFSFLRWEGGRFGRVALEQLKVATTFGDANLVHDAADKALQATNRYQAIRVAHAIADNLTIHTADGKLPDTFLKQDWQPGAGVPVCLTMVTGFKCDAFTIDLKGDGTYEIMLISGTLTTGFGLDSKGTWHPIGTWTLPCPENQDSLKAGLVKPIGPQPHPWPDLEVAGQRMRFNEPYASVSCPKLTAPSQ